MTSIVRSALLVAKVSPKIRELTNHKANFEFLFDILRLFYRLGKPSLICTIMYTCYLGNYFLQAGQTPALTFTLSCW